ncbi:MAG TPA: hypothetical protein VFL29_11590 [Candidatus Dormibacteraeota bacterium]|nr:hypothetical protein [Candidatus Dormibacteraeota bacterium]
MRVAVAALLFATIVSCGVSSGASATPSGAGLLSNPCGYLTTADFQDTLGLPLQGYRAGQACAYRDQHGNTCQVTVIGDAGQYATSKTAAGQYGDVEAMAAGEQGFYSAKAQTPGVWIFDFGFMKAGAFAGAVCGARFGASNPKPQAVRLANLIASRI